MRKNRNESNYPELERDLDLLHHPLPLDADFVGRLEDRLLAQAAHHPDQKPARVMPRDNRWGGGMSTRRTLAWGVLAVLLVVALAWSIQTFLPKENRAGSVMQTAAASGPVVTGLAQRSLYVPQGVDKSGRELNLERAWTTDDHMFLEFSLQDPSWIELDERDKLRVQEDSALGDDLILSNLSKREVLGSEQEFVLGGRILWRLQLPAPADPQQLVRLVFGDIPIIVTRDNGQPIPAGLFEGPWEFEFRPIQAVNLPSRQISVNEKQSSGSLAITVDEVLLSSESTLVTFRVDPPFAGGNWGMLGPVEIMVEDQVFGGQEQSNDGGRWFTYRFPAVPPDTNGFMLMFAPFQVSEAGKVNLSLDLSVATSGWQTLEFGGETLNFRVDPCVGSTEDSFILRYAPSDRIPIQTLIAGPDLSLAAQDDLGNTYEFEDQEIRFGSNWYILEHRLTGRGCLSEQASELVVSAGTRGHVTDPLLFHISLVDMEEQARVPPQALKTEDLLFLPEAHSASLPK